MSEFTGHIKSDNPIEFGDYVKIEMYRYGVENEFYIHKVVSAIGSNYFMDAPLRWDSEPTLHDEGEPVLLVIQCGVDESKVIRVAQRYCEKVKIG